MNLKSKIRNIKKRDLAAALTWGHIRTVVFLVKLWVHRKLEATELIKGNMPGNLTFPLKQSGIDAIRFKIIWFIVIGSINKSSKLL
ncbi:MAG: hypothetical protein HQM08_16230 [Candidatus Riflebacteria bacterium]|nr:hypothetical protein [Candidatus Riflebacteria bacterium]